MPNDKDLLRTLQVLAKEEPLNDWIFSRIAPYLDGRVLEVGCGIGTFTKHITKLYDVVAVDPWETAIQIARTDIGNAARFVVAEVDDLQGKVESGFGSVICLNVLEHIQDDLGALKTMRELLRPGGHVALLVPAGMWLYGSLDDSFGHFRRYSKKEVRALLESAGLVPVDVSYFNLLGIPGWILGGKILKIDQLSGTLLRVYRWILPPFKWIEDNFRVPIGLSVMAVGRRPLV